MVSATNKSYGYPHPRYEHISHGGEALAVTSKIVCKCWGSSEQFEDMEWERVVLQHFDNVRREIDKLVASSYMHRRRHVMKFIITQNIQK